MTGNLGYTELAPGTDNAEVVLNSNAANLDAAITEDLAVDLSAGDKALTLTQLQRAAFIMLNGATQARNVTVEAIKRTLFFRNYGTADVTIVRGTGSVVVKAGKGASIRLKGDADGIEDLSGSTSGGSASFPAGGGLNTVLGKKTTVDNDVEWQLKDPYKGLSITYPAGVTEATLTFEQMFNLAALAVNGASVTADSIINFPTFNGWFSFRNTSTFNITLKFGTNQYIAKPRSVTFVRLQAPNTISVTLFYLPLEGLPGQVLRKNSNVNGDADWSGYAVPGGGTAGQVLTKVDGTEGNVAWAAPASGGSGGNNTKGSAPHRYWRFLCLNSNNTAQGQRYFAIAEVEMRTILGGNDLCTGGVAFSRTNFSGNPAANAFDDNLNTQYETGGDQVHGASTTATAGNYIGYDFGTPVAINVLTLKNNANLSGERIISGVMQYSDDGSLYTNAWNVDGVNTANNTTTQSVNPAFDNGTTPANNYTLAQAQALTGLRNGDIVFITNGRKVGEAAGAGTGVPAYYSASVWRSFITDALVTT